MTDSPPVAEIVATNVPQSARSLDELVERERELMERVIQGEKELFYDLIQPYQPAVFRFAVAILGNNADAEEVAQETILKALANLPGFRRESKFSTWLIQIAINEAKVRRRTYRRNLHDCLDAGRPSDNSDYVPDDGVYTPIELSDRRQIPSEALEQKELRKALAHALLSLPEKYRLVLMLRDVQKISIAETSQILGISVQNVKTRTSRARLQMRDLLAPGWGANGRLNVSKERRTSRANAISPSGVGGGVVESPPEARTVSHRPLT